MKISAILTLCAGVALSGMAAAQGTLSLGVTTGSGTFASAGSVTCGAGSITLIDNVVKSEPLTITLTLTPAVVVPPPAVVTPHHLQLWVGVESCPPTSLSIGGTLFNVFIQPGASLSPVPIFDSFSNPFDPVFAPPIGATSATISVTLGADLFGPAFGFPLPALVLQAVCEDTPGAMPGLVVSNGVSFQMVDPQTAFAPTITSLSPTSASGTGIVRPQGPEAGGNTVTLNGTNLPAQTNWIAHPPVVRFGGVPATGVLVLGRTSVVCTAPPRPMLTMPPLTNAGLVTVTFQNDTMISPAGTPVTAPQQYLYTSGLTPNITGLAPANGSPEAGQSVTIQGTGFLQGAQVIWTSLANGALRHVDLPAAGAFGPGGTTITLTTTPFCTGPVSVQVINVDEQPSNLGTFTYNEVVPTLTVATPTFTATGLSAPNTFPSVVDTGGPLTLTGTNFISAASGLFAGTTSNPPTVPAASLAVTRVELTGPGIAAPMQMSVTPTNATTCTGTTTNNDQTGDFRPGLGLHNVTVINPPCVHAGTTTEVTSNALSILVRDASPPAITSVFPNVVASTLNATRIDITGSNFFRLTTASVQNFATSPAPVLASLTGPAVAFGSLFSPRVEIVNGSQIKADVPPGLASGPVTIRVFNPDGQVVSSSALLTVVPPLTNPATLTDAAFPDLDGPTLITLAANTSPIFLSLQMLAFSNQTVTTDAQQDVANGFVPTGPAPAYDLMFLFNTRKPDGTIRTFDFRSIDIPATITLTAPVVVGGAVLVGPGLKRVIIKAGAFDLDPVTMAVRFYQGQNFPFVLRSHSDFNVAGILDVSGNALINEPALGIPALKFQVRCEAQPPPAGGGVGGRGGSYYQNPLIAAATPAGPALVLPPMPPTFPSANLGASAAQITGTEGSAPDQRGPTIVSPLLTGGRRGIGRSPIGQQAGAGAGGGYSTMGLPGQPGATTIAAGGVTFGATTDLVPAVGQPPSDRLIYGTTNTDFIGVLGAAAPAFPSTFFPGGSGGGGGGGSLSLFVPCISVGGRGGNGGGSAVLISDRTFSLGTAGRIYADGETGYRGLDSFPVANQDPLLVLCAPGSGGGGSGGSVVVFAIADVDFSAQLTLAGTARAVSAAGGPGGAPTGSVVTPTANGGNGGDGRIRVALNAQSSRVAQRRTELQMLFQSGRLVPNVDPPANPLPTNWFTYPSP